jgi:hypothetical protein
MTTPTATIATASRGLDEIWSDLIEGRNDRAEAHLRTVINDLVDVLVDIRINNKETTS